MAHAIVTHDVLIFRSDFTQPLPDHSNNVIAVLNMASGGVFDPHNQKSLNSRRNKLDADLRENLRHVVRNLTKTRGTQARSYTTVECRRRATAAPAKSAPSAP